MNEKNNILDAWITIEQLSEGDISKNDAGLRQFDRNTNNIENDLLSFLEAQKNKFDISEDKFKNSGLAIYFDIFPFQIIVEKLQKKYNISGTSEEISTSNKFSFVMYFDNELNFLKDKFFITMSGYIKYYNELPQKFTEEERDIKDLIEKNFLDGTFNDVFIYLLDKYNVELKDCRFKFIKNMENGDINLHSFFIDDLIKAKNLNTENLERYLNGFEVNRKNLDSNKDSENFNPDLLEEILQPKYYPLGRYPSNSKYALSFMQQVAVNIALNDNNGIRSINGPPGTGKTTLLSDIFAELVVQQSKYICELDNKVLKGTLIYNEPFKMAVLPKELTSKSIVVASSNNGAVQNVVNDLPKISKIGNDDFKSLLNEIDYFKRTSNMYLNDDNSKELETTSIDNDDVNWGLFSLEGGNSKNLGRLLKKVVVAIDELEDENYIGDSNIYEQFKQEYSKLEEKREEIQRLYERIKPIYTIKNEKNKIIKQLDSEKPLKEKSLMTSLSMNNDEIEELKRENLIIESESDDLDSTIELFLEKEKIIQRDLDTTKSQKPSLVSIKKLFKAVEVEEYYEKINRLNLELNEISRERITKQEKRLEIDKNYILNGKKIENSTLENEKLKEDFQKWIGNMDAKLLAIDEEIKEIEDLINEKSLQAIDFDMSYDDLQKTNFWFDEEFRIDQSKLFILSLGVRKQFIFDNLKQIKFATCIWNDQDKYMSKENGREIVKTSWEWINFIVPVISTTFASFGRMFKKLGTNSIGNLFIDEAGQALPQASIGAIFRSQKVMAVGDPSQIRPVHTLDSNILNLIGRNYNVTDKFISSESSTQSLADNTSQYGFIKEEEWIGIPLWVHRRSNYPMFTISNELSYAGLMVHGNPKNESQGVSNWFNISGKANNKFVKEQGEYLKKQIINKLEEDPSLIDEIYVISPFRNVAFQLAKELDSIKFTKRENGKPVNVGTVHTFQGKEAKIVYFVLGADSESAGAANWAVSDSNMMNVAATRAKEEFYIIGDRSLYLSTGSKVVELTSQIIDEYNQK